LRPSAFGENVNIEKVTTAVLSLGLFATILFFGIVAYLSYDSSGPMAQIQLLAGSGLVVILTVTYFILKTSYTVCVFRLHGWSSGEYCVRLRVYRKNGQSYLRGHDKKIFRTNLTRGDAAQLPRSPSWTQLVTRNNDQVLLCGDVHVLDIETEDFYGGKGQPAL
jgi:hypothetical protein